MLTKIDGLIFIDLIESGIKNLDAHREILNDLNVFPVPDGDTGTNMVMTLKYGFEAIKKQNGSLSEISKKFSSASVFGARGNSGVIVSQFFKGIAECFKNKDEATPEFFCKALKSGYKYAFDAVAKPVEGTILTIFKDASKAVNKALPLETIDEVVKIYIEEAKESLKHTPELLPILKKAGVVDSGASGIVYFFEGIQKFLNGESIENTNEEVIEEAIDLSIFNKDTSFIFGYCIEGLIQLQIDVDDFDQRDFNSDLERVGNSIVTTLENDKVKIHIHTKKLGKVMEYCQKYGEFLTIKIENMTVQNLQKKQEQVQTKKYLYNENSEQSNFAIIAVATNSMMQKKLFDMGADIVILSEIAPSSQDFLDAFSYTNCTDILVFPNCSNSILSSMQAGSLYKKANVRVLYSRSLPECYASLSMIDFEGTIDDAVSTCNNTISNMFELSIYYAKKDSQFGNKKISADSFFALSDKKILNTGNALDDLAVDTVKKILDKKEYSVVSLYYGFGIAEEYVEHISELIMELGFDIEVAIVSTNEVTYSLTISFE